MIFKMKFFSENKEQKILALNSTLKSLNTKDFGQKNKTLRLK